MHPTIRFASSATDDLAIEGDVRHPCVWRTERAYGIAVRRDGAGRAHPPEIACGESEDGLRFTLDAEPAIVAGPENDDASGCDEPIVVPGAAALTVFYTGDDAAGGIRRLLSAAGKDIRSLAKRGRVLPYLERESGSRSAHGFPAPSGDWRLYFELSDTDSRLALALGAHLDGPWSLVDGPFAPRAGAWDESYVSPGPVVELHGRRVMFYNGAAADGYQRVGWIELADDGLPRGERCDAPVVGPAELGAAHETEVVASSALVRGDEISLYVTASKGRLARVVLTMETAAGGEDQRNT